MSHDQDEVRDFIDGDEIFMTAHSAHRSRYASRGKVIPTWVKSDTKIQKLLLTVFPKLKQDERQRKLAARWARVIYLYYRAGLTYSQIAEEMNLRSPNPKRPYKIVEDILTHINRASRGQSTNGSGIRGRKRGRPKIVR